MSDDSKSPAERTSFDGSAEARRPRHASEDDARAALDAAIDAWNRVGAWTIDRDPDPLAQAMVQALQGLARCAREHDADSLNEKHGPVRWARSRDPRTAFTVPRRSQTAREFVRVIGAQLESLDATETLPERARAAIVARASGFLLTRREFTSARHLPAPGDLEARESAMDAEVSAVAQRAGGYDAKAIAVALLVGWGLSRADARERLRDKDT